MRTKSVKIVLDGFGSFLGREKGCLVTRDNAGEARRYPLVDNSIAEIRIRSGNTVSVGALVSCGFWNIDCLILTQRGNPVAMLRSLNDGSHVKTRVCQYESLRNGRGLEIAKQFVLGKLEGENQLLKKHGLKLLDPSYSETVKALDDKDIRLLRMRLTSCESKFSRRYYSQVFRLFCESFRPERRRGFKAYDGLNNILNLSHKILSWKVHIALLKAKLEPFLGFLHAIQFGQPSLVCDFQELYRHLVDDFAIQFCRDVKASDFVLKSEDCSANRKGMRQYLNEKKTNELINGLNRYFERKVPIPRIRRGERQEIETLINEEALLLAEYLRNEREEWNPRISLI